MKVRIEMVDSVDEKLKGSRSAIIAPIAVSLWAMIGPMLVFLVPVLVFK